MVSQLWLNLCYCYCKRSRPGIDNKLPKNSSWNASLKLVVVPRTRIYGQSFGPHLKHSKPGSCCQWWSARHGYQRLWAIRFRVQWVLLKETSVGAGYCLLTADKYSFFICSFQQLGDGRIIWKPNGVGWGERQGEVSFNNFSFRASIWTSQVAQKSSFWKTDWKYAGMCLNDLV